MGFKYLKFAAKQTNAGVSINRSTQDDLIIVFKK